MLGLASYEVTQERFFNLQDSLIYKLAANPIVES